MSICCITYLTTLVLADLGLSALWSAKGSGVFNWSFEVCAPTLSWIIQSLILVQSGGGFTYIFIFSRLLCLQSSSRWFLRCTRSSSWQRFGDIKYAYIQEAPLPVTQVTASNRSRVIKLKAVAFAVHSMNEPLSLFLVMATYLMCSPTYSRNLYSGNSRRFPLISSDRCMFAALFCTPQVQSIGWSSASLKLRRLAGRTDMRGLVETVLSSTVRVRKY